jgi:cytochrome c oxidase subunit 3
MAQPRVHYFVPQPSQWPIIGAIGLFCTMFGAANWFNQASFGEPLFFAGVAIVLFMMFGWFGAVIGESTHGSYNGQVDRSFRWGMMWFIFSEVMFFGAFFGALFYARIYSVPFLGGASDNFFTNFLVWKGYEPSWPTNGPGDIGGSFHAMEAVGLAALNTLILLTSSLTVTIAHWGLREGKRLKFNLALVITIILGLSFVGLQTDEYMHAIGAQNLTLGTGIYGSTFFMLTGFHGAHVIIGATMLTIMLIRSLRGHFTPEHHFAFEAASWYWHFVDVVWLCLYTFVYWL